MQLIKVSNRKSPKEETSECRPLSDSGDVPTSCVECTVAKIHNTLGHARIPSQSIHTSALRPPHDTGQEMAAVSSASVSSSASTKQQQQEQQQRRRGRRPPPPQHHQQQYQQHQNHRSTGHNDAGGGLPLLLEPPTPEEAKRLGISLDGLLSIRHQQLVRKVKAAAGEHRRRLPHYCDRYRAGESVLSLAREADYPPYLLARMMVEVRACVRRVSILTCTPISGTESVVHDIHFPPAQSHDRSCACSPAAPR